MIDFISNNWLISLLILNYLLAIGTAFFVIRNNGNPVSTLSYVLGLLLFPFVGLLVYLFFGQEYRKDKMFKRQGVFNHKIIKKWEKKLLVDEESLEKYEEAFLEQYSAVAGLVQNTQRKPLTFGNDVLLLNNGDEKFEALFEAIRKAQRFIHLEYYIFGQGKIGKQLLDLLCERVQEGIAVKVIYDYVGSQLASSDKRRLEDAGVEIYPFMPVWFPNLTRKLNYRDHRKLCVIDGRIGFVGGINVSDEYVNSLNDSFWRDIHLRLEGNVVKSLHAHFLLNWNFVTGSKEISIAEDYFPKVKDCGEIAMQIVASGPDSDSPHIMRALFTAINQARESILITTPYFIPNEPMLVALKTAAARGVDIQLMCPRDGDSWAAKYATHSYFREVLTSGIRIFHYCKGMLHAKTMLIDGQLCSVGTSNFDYRSFEINFEINALIYNEDFTQKMQQHFEKDKQDCEEVLLELWLERPLKEKIKESFSRLWAPLL